MEVANEETSLVRNEMEWKRPRRIGVKLEKHVQSKGATVTPLQWGRGEFWEGVGVCALDKGLYWPNTIYSSKLIYQDCNIAWSLKHKNHKLSFSSGVLGKDREVVRRHGLLLVEMGDFIVSVFSRPYCWSGWKSAESFFYY